MVCLGRGLSSLRANWELVPVVLAQSLLTTGLTLAGVFMVLTALGVGVVTWLRELGPDWQRRLLDDLTAGLEGPPALLPLVAPLLGATLVWTLAFALWCYLQGGVVGILAEGEAAAGEGRPGWRSFRRFSAAGLDLAGRRLFWKYFWLNHLLGAVASIWLLLAMALAALSGGLVAAGDTTFGVAAGCVGLAPLLLALVAIGLWSLLATVEVARPGCGVWAASRRALGTLRRRLGDVLVISLLALVAWMFVGAVFMPLEWAVVIASGDRLAVWLGGRGALMLVEALVDGALVVGLIAALAALADLRPVVVAEPGR